MSLLSFSFLESLWWILSLLMLNHLSSFCGMVLIWMKKTVGSKRVWIALNLSHSMRFVYFFFSLWFRDSFVKFGLKSYIIPVIFLHHFSAFYVIIYLFTVFSISLSMLSSLLLITHFLLRDFQTLHFSALPCQYLYQASFL